MKFLCGPAVSSITAFPWYLLRMRTRRLSGVFSFFSSTPRFCVQVSPDGVAQGLWQRGLCVVRKLSSLTKVSSKTDFHFMLDGDAHVSLERRRSRNRYSVWWLRVLLRITTMLNAELLNSWWKSGTPTMEVGKQQSWTRTLMLLLFSTGRGWIARYGPQTISNLYSEHCGYFLEQCNGMKEQPWS